MRDWLKVFNKEVQQFIYIVHVLFFVIHINNGRIVERTVDCHLKSMESWIATEEIQYLPKFKNSKTSYSSIRVQGNGIRLHEILMYKTLF
jgi:hypothetical protein